MCRCVPARQQADGSLLPVTGPHKQRECLPLALIIRNRLKYALTYKEVTSVVMSRAIKVDGKVRTEKCYPAGFMGAQQPALRSGLLGSALC